MSMAFPKPSKLDARELKTRADFVAIVSRYTRLRRAGRQYVGLCPFHSELRPSFYIEPERKLWKCFGCGAGGDLFAFVMLAEGCNFCDALRIVAVLSGVASETGPRSGPRFRASVGASPPAAKRQSTNSQSGEYARTQILAALDATNQRMRAVEAMNRAATAALATACEPERGDVVLFTCQKPDNSP